MSLTIDRSKISQEKYQTLSYFREALGSEYKHLVKHPELLWQQLYNRLQWVGQKEEKNIVLSEIIKSELTRKCLPLARPWFHNRTVLNSSKTLQESTVNLNDYISHVKFNPVDNRVYTADRGGRVKIWEVGSGTIELVFKAHKGPIRAFALSPDGEVLVTAANENRLLKWDARTGKKVAELKGHRGPISDCAFSPDGEILATAGEDHTVRLWNGKTGRKKRTLARHTGKVNCCQFSPDGKFLATSGADNKVILWGVPSGRLKAEMIGHVRPVVNCLFSFDGKYLASEGSDLSVRIWDLTKLEEVVVLAPQTKEYSSRIVNDDGKKFISYAFSRDGKLLATGGFDHLIKLWNVSDGKELYTLYGHQHATVYCSFSCDDKFLFSASGDSTIRAWDADLGLLVAHFSSLEPINCCDISNDGNMLAAGDSRGNLYILETFNLKNISVVLKHYNDWRKKVYIDQSFIKEKLGPPCYKKAAPKTDNYKRPGPGFVQAKSKLVWDEYVTLFIMGVALLYLTWIMAKSAYWLLIICAFPLFYYSKMWKLAINRRLYCCTFCNKEFSVYRRDAKVKSHRYKCSFCKKYNFL